MVVEWLKDLEIAAEFHVKVSMSDLYKVLRHSKHSRVSLFHIALFSRIGLLESRVCV